MNYVNLKLFSQRYLLTLLLCVVLFLTGCLDFDCPRSESSWCDGNVISFCGILGDVSRGDDCSDFGAVCGSFDIDDGDDSVAKCEFPKLTCEPDVEQFCHGQILMDCESFNSPVISVYESCADDGEFCIADNTGTNAECSHFNETCDTQYLLRCTEDGEEVTECYHGIWDSNWLLSLYECCELPGGDWGMKFDEEISSDFTSEQLECNPAEHWLTN